jgi:hypothetical protein
MPIKDLDRRRAANRKIQTRHYRNNREYYRLKREKRTQEIQEWLLQYKTKNGCCKCPETHVACLDFHHRDPAEKEIALAKVARQGWGLKRVMKEVAKCDLLCSNCHRKEHWENQTVGLGRRATGSIPVLTPVADFDAVQSLAHSVERRFQEP